MIPVLEGLDKVGTYQQYHANQTLEWMGEDNQERYNHMLSNPEQRRLLEQSGWTTTSIVYRFNSQGFRSHEFDAQGDYFCVFGDSVTFGAALRQDQIYCSQLEERLGIKCYNFGQSGGSNDTATRWAMTYLPTLRPRFVIWQTTFDHRFEWLTGPTMAQVFGVQAAGGGKTPETRGDLYVNWIDVDMNRSINLAKNLMCMRYMCKEIGVPLVEIDITEFFSPPEDRARDLLHPGPQAHKKNANRMMDRLGELGLS